MNRILGVFLGLALGVVMIAPVSAQTGVSLLGVSGSNGVYCEINEVKLFALSAEDCEKAGGAVTHIVSTEVKEIGSDNPNQEPEIQRTKDKEPVAP
ncbi:MAG: hypothetical protein O6830_03835 [Candidatus Dadabacteria bacterium]|jgi:hypothetical protein|nr:hypothetical protein [Candidatus Dadabacteria bacterium]